MYKSSSWPKNWVNDAGPSLEDFVPLSFLRSNCSKCGCRLSLEGWQLSLIAMKFLSNRKADLTWRCLRIFQVLLWKNQQKHLQMSKDAKHSIGTCTSVILVAILAPATSWLNRNRMEQRCNFGSKDRWTSEEGPQIRNFHGIVISKQNDSLTHTQESSLVLNVESESFQVMQFAA